MRIIVIKIPIKGDRLKDLQMIAQTLDKEKNKHFVFVDAAGMKGNYIIDFYNEDDIAYKVFFILETLETAEKYSFVMNYIKRSMKMTPLIILLNTL